MTGQERQDEDITIEAAKAALTGESPPQGEERQRYAARLLSHALTTRDPEITGLIAGLMDADPALDQDLERTLGDHLEEQPDAVYAFIRPHLNERLEKRWLRRLKMAALFSLRVAINDADTETIVNWLTLIAREPSNYDLADVLHYGILAAQPRARHDPELARQLILLAARRDPSNLDALLSDEALLIALPDNLGRCLRDLNGDPLLLLQNRGVEIFLVALAWAARQRSGTMFTPAVVSKVWDIYSGSSQPPLPPQYRVESVVSEWLNHGVTFLSREALETLLSHLFSARRDDLLMQFFDQPDAASTLLPLFVPALERAERNTNEAIDLIGRLLAADKLTPQQAADLYLTMLDGVEWTRDAMPLIQQWARALHQYPALTAPPEALWKLLNVAMEARDEFMARVAVKKLVGSLETIEDEAELVDGLRRLVNETRWSESAYEWIAGWWRGFIRGQSLNRLGRLDKALEGRRSLEDERRVLGTLIALRRALGGRSLAEFAEDVRAAHTVLEALADSFDPGPRRPDEFDPAMLRAELDARGDQITPESRQVLANHLKELARLIGEMGDNRTRANLMRRGDELDRDLMTGEQPPHSAVDAMKWLSGFWGSKASEDGGKK